MIEIILEILCLGVALLIAIYLWQKTKHTGLSEHNGWKFIFSGFFLLLLGMLLDVTDDFPVLNQYFVIGDIPYEVFLEKVMCGLLGFILIAIGIWQWVPSLLQAEKNRIQLSELNRNLEGTIEARTQELQQSEERYRQVFDTNQAVKLIIDAEDGRIVEANNAAVIFYGYDIETLKAMSISEINILPEHQIREEMQSAERNEKLYFNFRHKLKSGKIRDVEVYSGPVQSDGRKLLYSIIHDVTERKLAEDALRRAQKMEAVGQLTGGIAHDFNNILSIVLGHLSLLERNDNYDEKSLQRIESIKIATQRAIDLTRQLLVFSRREADSLKLVDINQLVSEMDNLIIRSLTPEVEVEQVLDEGVWKTEIDPGDFKDALLNLTLNARDAMHGRGHLKIAVSNCVLDTKYCKVNAGVEPGEYVQLTVSDTGIGITDEEMEHIFEPFFTTKEKGEGTGLGLSMVFGFVHRSGGSIKVSSERGVETTFKLYLPRAQHASSDNSLEITDKEVLPKSIGNESLLVVDDEKEIINIVTDILQAQGYKIYAASDGEQALKVLNQHPDINMLLSDVVMPGGINGYELAEQAQSRHSNIKVLLSSGYTAKALKSDDKKSVQYSLLKKPYKSHDLVKKVRAILDGTIEPQIH